MKIKSVIKRGEQQYVVDGRVNGKRKRTFFKSKKNARAYLAIAKPLTPLAE